MKTIDSFQSINNNYHHHYQTQFTKKKAAKTPDSPQNIDPKKKGCWHMNLFYSPAQMLGVDLPWLRRGLLALLSCMTCISMLRTIFIFRLSDVICLIAVCLFCPFFYKYSYFRCSAPALSYVSILNYTQMDIKPYM